MIITQIEQIIVLLINIIGIWLALWVYSINKKEKTNQWFLIATFFLLLWVDFAFLGTNAKEIGEALLWYKLNGGMVLLFLISFYYFTLSFLNEGGKYPILDKLFLAGGFLFFFILIFTDFIIKDVIIKSWGAEIIFGKGVFIFNLFALVVALVVVRLFVKKYAVFSKKERLKVQYLLIGVVIFVLFNVVFNIISPSIWGSVQYQHFGDYSAIFLLGFTAYAIVKQELFGIKVVLAALLVGSIAILLFLDALVLTKTLSLQILKGIISIIFLAFGYFLIKSVLREIELRAELQKAYEELKRLDKAKSEFISIASHQLRTPLTAIKGYISMIIEGSYGKMSEKTKEPMENVYKSNERLIKLVNDLLSISRIESGRMEINLEKFSLEDIISSVVNELKIEAEKKGLKLIWEKPAEPLPKISADRDKIRQVILNVVDNGIRYTRRGEIAIKSRVGEGSLLIEVSDTGAGLTKEEISYLFESFSRGKAGTRFWSEGVGLGLYVAKKFIELHNGKIWAESKGKGKGSTFYIELPIK